MLSALLRFYFMALYLPMPPSNKLKLTMKNLQMILVGFTMLLTISACSVSKEATSMKQKINGNWLLETITTEGIEGKVTAIIFNEASFNCFVGSSWNFVANNSSGNYHYQPKWYRMQFINPPHQVVYL